MKQMDEARTESFATYLAKAYIAKKGFSSGTVPEARLLFEACDIVLTRLDGLSLEIIGIVDRETDPSKKFELTKDALDKAGRACLRYTGKAGFRKLPVVIRIMEAGSTPIGREIEERLEPLKSRSPFSKVLISACALDVSNGKVWANSPFRGFLTKRFVQRLVTGPRLPEHELVPEAHPAMGDKRPLVLTYTLLAILAAIFLGEEIFRIGQEAGALDPSVRTLIALGALDKSLVVGGGEWWRLFSAPLLHGGVLHLVFNGIALFFAGIVLENVAGRAWFAAIFAVSATTGALVSLALNPTALISVGASGAIMGLFGAAFALSFRYPRASGMRRFMRSGSLRVLIPSLIPLTQGIFGMKIDFAAHLGGALGGFAVGVLLWRIWPRDDVLPPYRRLASTIVALAVCATAYAASAMANGYQMYSLASFLIPDGHVPEETSVAKANSQSLLATYPRDPRSHIYRAWALADAGDDAGAESEWKAALNDDKMLRTFFEPGLETFIRAELALTLRQNGKESEAREVARPVCAEPSPSRKALIEAKLCA
jgi:rhomboid protease GluP